MKRINWNILKNLVILEEVRRIHPRMKFVNQKAIARRIILGTPQVSKKKMNDGIPDVTDYGWYV